MTTNEGATQNNAHWTLQTQVLSFIEIRVPMEDKLQNRDNII